MKTITYDEYINALRDLATKTTYLQIQVPVVDLFALIGALQLALRHPNFPPASRQIVTNWITSVADNLPSHILRQHIHQGFDPNHDV